MGQFIMETATRIPNSSYQSPLVRKRPRNSELRNKLKFNKDNYRLSADIELENGEPDYLFKKEIECQTTLCASVSQGDYLELAARVKELEHKVEPKWDFIKTWAIGLAVIILVPLLYIAINEKYVTEDIVIERNPNANLWPNEELSEPVVQDTNRMQSIAEGILTEWSVNIWSDLQKLFH